MRGALLVAVAFVVGACGGRTGGPIGVDPPEDHGATAGGTTGDGAAANGDSGERDDARGAAFGGATDGGSGLSVSPDAATATVPEDAGDGDASDPEVTTDGAVCQPTEILCHSVCGCTPCADTTVCLPYPRCPPPPTCPPW
jgi:hypothetical protein